MNHPPRSTADSGRSALVSRLLGAKFPDLAPRIASGFVLIGAALSTAVLGGVVFHLFWLAAAIAVHWEWQTLIAVEGSGRRSVLGGAALAIALPLLYATSTVWPVLVLLVAAFAVAALAPGERRVLAAAGLLYAGALLLSVEWLRSSRLDGLQAILWLFAVVWGTDIMAYFGGRLIGGPKLWPRLSPSKTWAGFLIGITSGALAGLAVVPAPRPYLLAFVLGLIAGAAAQGGDLFESALKRRFGVKDASRLIPGHGGVMDRLDGFIAAAVFAAALGLARFGVASPALGLFQW